MSAILQMSWQLNDQKTVVQFDASIHEQHQGTALVTDHQVETGPNITDHIRPLPRRLSVEALVSDTPVGADVLLPSSARSGTTQRVDDTEASTVQFPERFFRVKDVYNALLDAQRGGALILVDTSLKSYADMAIVSLSAPRDVDHGNAVQFSIDLQEIITVNVVETRSPAPKAEKKSLGQKPTREAKPEEKKRLQSTAYAQAHAK